MLLPYFFTVEFRQPQLPFFYRKFYVVFLQCRVNLVLAIKVKKNIKTSNAKIRFLYLIFILIGKHGNECAVKFTAV